MENITRVSSDLIPDLAFCTRCKTQKTKDQFRKDSRYKSGVNSWCHQCLQDYKKEKRKRENKMELRKRKPIDGKLKCWGCKESKLTDEFYPNPRTCYGFGSYCKACESKRRKDRILKDPEAHIRRRQESAAYRKIYGRKKNLQKKYGISFEAYNAILEAQGGRCAICLTDKNNNNKALCVDHCHKTNKVRGILCNRCNRSIGLLHDSWKIAQASADYLKKHAGEA